MGKVVAQALLQLVEPAVQVEAAVHTELIVNQFGQEDLLQLDKAMLVAVDITMALQ